VKEWTLGQRLLRDFFGAGLTGRAGSGAARIVTASGTGP
jgi:hypothetical protein